MSSFFRSLPAGAALGALLTCSFAATVEAQSTWYVNANWSTGGTGTSWASPFQDLQAAITVAQPGDSIWVAAGTYRPSLPTNPIDPRSATFTLPHDVAIYGGFRGNEATLAERKGWFDQTILSGDIGTPGSVFDNCYHVAILKGTNHFVAALLDGFTIRDGYGHGGPGNPSRGGGIAVNMGQGTHGPTLFAENLTVRDNWAEQGGGIAVTNLGMVYMAKSRILNNEATDAGGGAYVLTGSLWTVSTRWEGNFANVRGGALFTNSTSTNMVRLMNDVLYGNQSDLGGAIYVEGSQFVNGMIDVRDCTIACNFANDGVSIFANTAATQPAVVTVANSILWHEPQGGPATLAGSGSSINVSWSCVLGGFAGSGNIGSDPMFVDWVHGDLRLQAGSPAIDAGNNGLLPSDFADLDGDGDFAEALPLDIAGNRRVKNDPNAPNTGLGAPPVDMGGYER